MKNSKKKNDICEVYFVDKKKVDLVRRAMETDDAMLKLAGTFKVLGDPTRTKIIFALAKSELCVCDVATLLGISQSATSHQLRVIRNMDLVRYRKDGRIAYYSLNDDHIRNLFSEGLRHVKDK